jgi:hypothetical protein
VRCIPRAGIAAPLLTGRRLPSLAIGAHSRRPHGDADQAQGEDARAMQFAGGLSFDGSRS